MSLESFDNHEQDPATSPSLSPELRNREMFCLHGIALDSVGLNSILPEDTSLEERFRIAIVDKPALSASIHTEPAITSKAGLWSSVGVVISEGTIQAVSPKGKTDLSSIMLDGGRRSTPDQSAADITAALDNIAFNDGRYPDMPLNNEIIVRDPIIAGVYFKDTAGLADYEINRKQTFANANTVPEVVKNAAMQFGLPVYAVRTSGIYEVKIFDPETGKYRLTADTTPRVHAAEVVSRRQAASETIAVAGSLATQAT